MADSTRAGGPSTWRLRDRTLTPGRPALVMGIVNATPDSFSDGGLFAAPDAAIAHGLELVRSGADLLDVGGESSRPGAAPVPVHEELARVIPVVRALAAATDVPISVDTTKAAVADAALAAGAHVVNDVRALTGDPAMAEVVRRHGAGIVLMHMQGTPQTMQLAPHYGDVVAEVFDYLQTRLQAAAAAGIDEDRVVLDPGIGFGKASRHNLLLLAHLARLGELGRPVLLGVSRKGFLGRLLDRPVDRRLAASLAAACHALVTGGAQILRVHDVAETKDAVRVIAALEEAASCTTE